MCGLHCVFFFFSVRRVVELILVIYNMEVPKIETKRSETRECVFCLHFRAYLSHFSHCQSLVNIFDKSDLTPQEGHHGCCIVGGVAEVRMSEFCIPVD